MRSLYLVTLFIIVNALQVTNLVRESGFHHGSGAWGISNDLVAGEIRPVQPIPTPLEPIEATNQNSVVFAKKDAPQGLFQAIFSDKTNNLHKIKSPLLLTFQHQAHFVNTDVKYFMYVNIRYRDGVILPVYLFGNSKNHTEWQTECLYVPYYGRKIENILVSVGHYDLQSNPEEPSQIILDNISIFAFDEKMNEEQVAARYKNKCTIYRKIQRSPQIYPTKPNFYQRQMAYNLTDVTVVTQLTVDRVPSLKKNVKSYKGPVSASIYIQSDDHLKELSQYWRSSPLLRKYVSFHVVFPLQDEVDNPRRNNKLSHSYPINYLRNIARKYAESDYILYLDCDFVVSESLFTDITDGKIVDIMARLDNQRKNMLILPGFFCSDKPPKSRQELLQQWERGDPWLLQPITFDSHKLSRYDVFKDPTSPEFYPPEKIQWSEPYFIAPRSVPLYSERFIGCGRDKLQQNFIAEKVGFKYTVWKKHFICHVPHSQSKQPLCDEYPPGKFTYNALSAHFWMLQKELKRGLIDFENYRKETVLRPAKIVHSEWVARQKFHHGSGYHLLLIIPMIMLCVVLVRCLMQKRNKDEMLKL